MGSHLIKTGVKNIKNNSQQIEFDDIVKLVSDSYNRCVNEINKSKIESDLLLETTYSEEIEYVERIINFYRKKNTKLLLNAMKITKTKHLLFSIKSATARPAHGEVLCIGRYKGWPSAWAILENVIGIHTFCGNSNQQQFQLLNINLIDKKFINNVVDENGNIINDSEIRKELEEYAVVTRKSWY
ncbi:hypothetical protein [Pseudomonas phage vB_Pa-PAC2]